LDLTSSHPSHHRQPHHDNVNSLSRNRFFDSLHPIFLPGWCGLIVYGVNTIHPVILRVRGRNSMDNLYSLRNITMPVLPGCPHPTAQVQMAEIVFDLMKPCVLIVYSAIVMCPVSSANRGAAFLSERK